MNETKIDKLVENKLDYYGDMKTNNFILEQELTVRITLNEYRDLVSERAVAENKIKDAEINRWERDSENKKLKEDIKILRKNLNKYINEYGLLEDEEESENEDE